MKSMEIKEARRLYERARDELLSLRQSSSEIYGRSLMTLSSVLLAASLSFISKLIPLSIAKYILLLHLSWVCFGLAIISTIMSFIYGQIAITKLLKAAERYYLHEEIESYNVSLIVENRLKYIHLFSGINFIIGIIFSIAFVILNTR